MKKTFLGIIVGLILGAAVTWWVSRPAATAPAAADAAAAAAAPEPGTVILETDEQEKANITTAQPTPMVYKAEAKGFARVLDAAPLAALLTQLSADQAALKASSNEYQRLQTLQRGGNASARAIEAAEAAQSRDQAQINADHGKFLAEWGQALDERSDLATLAHDLISQKTALIRVDMLGGEKLPSEPRELRVAPAMGNGEPVPAEILGPAPNTDPQTQGTGFLALVSQHPPPPGTQLVAWMTDAGEGEKGLRLPRSAIIRYEGDTFVYVLVNAENFERWRVKVGLPLRDGGVFISSGVTAQDHVVVTSAQQLLSEELKAASGGP